MVVPKVLWGMCFVLFVTFVSDSWSESSSNPDYGQCVASCPMVSIKDRACTQSCKYTPGQDFKTCSAACPLVAGRDSGCEKKCKYSSSPASQSASPIPRPSGVVGAASNPIPKPGIGETGDPQLAGCEKQDRVTINCGNEIYILSGSVNGQEIIDEVERPQRPRESRKAAVGKQ